MCTATKPFTMADIYAEDFEVVLTNKRYWIKWITKRTVQGPFPTFNEAFDFAADAFHDQLGDHEYGR